MAKKFAAEEIAPVAGEADEIRARLCSLREKQRLGAWLQLAEEVFNGREGAILESLETLDDRASALPCEEPEWNHLRESLTDVRVAAREFYDTLRTQRPALAEDVAELPRLEGRHRAQELSTGGDLHLAQTARPHAAAG